MDDINSSRRRRTKSVVPLRCNQFRVVSVATRVVGRTPFHAHHTQGILHCFCLPTPLNVRRNQLLEGTEGCDDGGQSALDGCSASCEF